MAFSTSRGIDRKRKRINQMRWSPQQDRALARVAKWVESRDQQVYRLFGYAGTGKTTLARHFAEGVRGQVLFAAYTGKAAHVMRGKGCRDASTIHRLIYRAEDGFICPNHPDDMYGTNTDGCRRCNSPLVRRPRFTLNRDSSLSNASLLIVDECSMVNESLGRDLMSFGKPILVLGDPFQLPPPEGCGFFTAAEPDIMLTEVHRQARDSPIIAMSMTVREGGRLDIGRYGESRVVAACDLEDADADQILVGLNARRRLVNATRREELGLTDPSPMAGDRLVCLRNDRVMGLLNGSL
jgi:ATP-dependent exoDNAse (exonuclease V) alpha subunit